MFINISGTWRKVADGFVNINGTWRKINDAFVNISGTWRRFWSAGSLAPQFTVTITQTTNATTGLTTLTGTNYYWSPGPPSLTYSFQWWNGTSWSNISTGTATNPSFGSSTSYTQLLQSEGPAVYVQPNQLNRFRFRVDATYGSQSASSNSSETTIQGPTSVTLTAGTPAVTSVPLSWSASTGANRYMIYYSTNNSTFTLYAGTNSLSTTVAGLSSNTLYYFKVIPITGTTNDTGYYGSYSNTVTATTTADLINTIIPTISGTIKEGQTITGSNGSWNVTPDSYLYQWLYFDGNINLGYEGYVPLSGATSASYAIPSTYRSTNGTGIRLRVTAVKSGYTSTNAYSTAATVAALASVPGAPTNAAGTNVGTNRAYGNGAVNLSWTAPTNTGGVSLTGYKIEFQVPSVSTAWFAWSANTTDTSSTSITLTGLAAAGHNFRIYAVNSVGTSTSASATGTIAITTVPQAPTIGSAVTFNGSISVTYTANNTGGSSVTEYKATSTPGSITGTASTGAISVTGLTHNTAYTFKVTATNANGTSLASSASNTAYGVNIGAPTVTSSTVSGKTITLNFTAGTNSASTRALINGNFDGVASGSSYTFTLTEYDTVYSLGLFGRGTVNSLTYDSITTTDSYSTGPAPSAPSGGSASISGTATQGNNLTLAKTDATGNPNPSASWVWQRNSGSAGAWQNVQTGGTTYALGTNDAEFSIRATVTWSNGTSPDRVITTNSIGPITPIYWNIFYSANGGTGAPATTKIIQGKSGNVSSSTPTRSGFTFNGWENNVGLSFTSGQLVTPTADISLTAKWTPVVAQYTITWNANGGTVSPTSNTVTEGSSVTAPTPTRSGFIFSNWRFPASGGDPVFLAAGASYVPAGNRTWTAIWAVPTPVISSIVARNGGTGGAYKMQWTITSTNTASYSFTVRYGSTTSTTNNFFNTASSSTIQTNLGNTINDYYILEITPWSGAGATGTAGVARTTSIKRNTGTPSNLTNNY